jgi:hypothetical protein
MFIALAATFFMPQSPGNWKFLTPRQQYIASERIRREHDAVGHPCTLHLILSICCIS